MVSHLIFAELGVPTLEIFLDHSKTKTLTSLTSKLPISFNNIATEDVHHLCSALATCPG
jgi:hypothetical protein